MAWCGVAEHVWGGNGRWDGGGCMSRGGRKVLFGVDGLAFGEYLCVEQG